MHLKKNSVSVQMNKSYFTETKFFIFRTQSKKNFSQKQFNKLNQNIDNFTRKLEILILMINVLLEKIAQKKQFRYFI